MAPALGPAQPDPGVLALKANRPALLEGVRLLLDDPQALPGEIATTTDGDHGRIETRRAAIVHDIAWLAEGHGFPGLKAIGKVTATREQDGRTTTATRYYLLSRPLTAARFLAVVRAHWQIESRLHWVLDVVLDEDPCPRPQGPRAREPRPAAPLRPQRPARQPRDGLDPGQDQACRLGRRFPPPTPRHRLMRLPWGGVGGAWSVMPRSRLPAVSRREDLRHCLPKPACRVDGPSCSERQTW
jgi:predicted transposase YbfD/YdcC